MNPEPAQEPAQSTSPTQAALTRAFEARVPPAQLALTRAREARVARRRERLAQAIDLVKTAIMQAAVAYPTLAAGESQHFRTEVERLVRQNRVGISPILIAILIQLIPILIQWFFRDRLGFQNQIDDLARDIAYNTVDCITPYDLAGRSAGLEAQLQAVKDGTTAGASDPVELTRIQKLIAIVAIIKLLSRYVEWWTK